MSAYRFVTLTCDGCGEVWDNGIETRTREARRIAERRHGWMHRPSPVPGEPVQDWCNICIVLEKHLAERSSQ